MSAYEDRGVKGVLWNQYEMLHSSDISALQRLTYENFCDILVAATGFSVNDVVVTGLEIVWTAGMTAKLSSGVALSYAGRYFTGAAWGFAASVGNYFGVLNPVDQSIAFDVGSVSDRYDIVEIRPVITAYDPQSREFKDPSSGVITSSVMPTRVEYGCEFQIKKGTPGSGVAPAKTPGWIKVAEAFIPASASVIAQSNIHLPTSFSDVGVNALWTTETTIAWKQLSASGLKLYTDTKVSLTGAEVIAGVKTFSSFPVLPSSNPTQSYEATHKAYVDKYIMGDVIIQTQADFDAVFTGTIAANTSIFIKKKATPYLLNNAVVLSSGVRIVSDGAVVNRNSVTARFSTTYKNSLGVTSGTIGTDYITMDSNPTGYFNIGDIVAFYNSNRIYEVRLVDATKVYLTSNIIGASASASDILYSYQENIFIDGWTFDGKGGVNGLSGSYTFSGDGGAFFIPFTYNSIFNLRVTNSKASGDGGAYSSGVSATTMDACYSVISNVDNCYSGNNGGGCHALTFCKVSRISNCYAVSLGGGCCNVMYSELSNIIKCSTGGAGGGCSWCKHSVIYGIYNCTAAGGGGGCSSCDYSTISDIKYCSDASYGGGCHLCQYCTITDVMNCSAPSGGGCYSCPYSDISNISFCSASGAFAGGCQNCDYCFFHGTFIGNTTNGGSYATLANCVYSLPMIIRSAGTSTASVTAATQNVN